MRAVRMVTILLAGTAIIAACATGDPTIPSTTTPSTTVPSSSPSTTARPVPPAVDPVADLAADDLATRLGIPADDIEMIRTTKVTWPNGALGCPQPGGFYTQALVSGAQVILLADDRYYAYHAGSDGVPFLCASDAEDGGFPSPPPPPGVTH